MWFMDHACVRSYLSLTCFCWSDFFFVFVLLLSPSNHLIPGLLPGDIPVHGVSPSPTAIIHFMAVSS
jgi:hypothetical protein